MWVNKVGELNKNSAEKEQPAKEALFKEDFIEA